MRRRCATAIVAEGHAAPRDATHEHLHAAPTALRRKSAAGAATYAVRLPLPMAAQAAPDVEEDLLDALADGGLLNEQPEARPATAEETYIHHVGMRRATIFSGCLCGVRADPPSVIDATQVILALIITITFHVIWLTGEIPFIGTTHCSFALLSAEKIRPSIAPTTRSPTRSGTSPRAST